MVKATRKRKIEFLIHEITLTFVGTLILTFGILAAFAGGWNWLLSIVAIWLGLLIFIMPIVWKIEQL